MRKMIKAVSGLTAVAAIALMSGGAWALTNSDNATVSATIVAPVTVQNTAPMSIGQFAATSDPGYIWCHANTSLAVSNVVAISTTCTPAAFEVIGAASFTWGLSASQTDLVGQNTGSTMSAYAGLIEMTPATGSGTETVQVGAGWHVGANQAADTYGATITLTANYQ